MTVYARKDFLHKSESTFNEYLESGTPDWDRKIPCNDYTLTLSHERMPDASHQAYLDEAYPGHPGLRTCEFSFKQNIWGHGASPTGSTTEHSQALLLRLGLGDGVTDTDGTTIASATSATSFTLTTAGQWAAGTIGRCGAKGDTRGDGQAFVVASMAGAVVTALVGLPAQPDAADVVYATLMQHWASSGGAAPAGTERFMVLHSTTNQQYLVSGAQLTGLGINYNIGQGLAEYEFRYKGFYRRVARTFPDALALDQQYAAPVQAGTLHIADVGTATKTAFNVPEIEVTLNLDVQPIEGGSSAQYCNISGWTRTAANASIRVAMLASDLATFETFWDQANDALTYKHMLFNATATSGRAYGFYAPRVMPMGQRPNNLREINGQNYGDVFFQTRRGATTTNDLTVSPFRLFCG